MHLAVAVGAPTIHLYGPVDAAAFGPWGDPRRHRVLTSAWTCAPCNRLDFTDASLPLHPCVRAITVEQVLAALPAALA
jgi:heptosyltransferase-2/heptosyltransferase-3